MWGRHFSQLFMACLKHQISVDSYIIYLTLLTCLHSLVMRNLTTRHHHHPRPSSAARCWARSRTTRSQTLGGRRGWRPRPAWTSRRRICNISRSWRSRSSHSCTAAPRPGCWGCRPSWTRAWGRICPRAASCRGQTSSTATPWRNIFSCWPPRPSRSPHCQECHQNLCWSPRRKH